MAKTEVVEWNSFFSRNAAHAAPRHAINVSAAVGAAVYISFSPFPAYAADSAWINVFSTVLNIADWLCAGVIVFAGGTWMFGNRTKAIEFLFSGAAGYLIVRHALDIRDWLKSL